MAMVKRRGEVAGRRKAVAQAETPGREEKGADETRAPSRGEIEELFWGAGLDLLVDGRKLFFGAEFVEMMAAAEDPALVALPGGRYELTVGGHVFALGPYLEEVDGHPLRWVRRAARHGEK